MRILYSHRIQSHDGQSVHVEEMIRAFRDAGHEVLVIGPSFYANSGFGDESRLVAMVRRALPGALGELAEIAYAVPSYLRLWRAWRRFRPELVYERYSLFHLAGALLARLQGALLYLEVNAPLADERARFNGLRLTRLAHALERFTWRSAARVLAVTDVLKHMIATADVPLERISVVPNGVVPARFPPRPPENSAGPVTLGFVGFVRGWHGLDQALRGMATDPSGVALTLHVLGTGPALEDLRTLAGELGIADRVRFEGLVEHESVPARLAEFDIALQPRATPYASPLKIFDYMAAGCAIVAPDQPNIREILQHGETALLFDPAAPDALWSAISLLATDAPLRRRLGRQARARLEAADYSWAGNAARIVAAAQRERRPGAAAEAQLVPLQ